MEKCYSYDGENYNFESKLEAIDAGELQVGAIVYEGEPAIYVASDFVKGAGMYLMEMFQEAAYEEAGDYSGDWPYVTVGDVRELEHIISEWLQAKSAPKFYTVRNIKEITVTQEDLDDLYS